MLTGRGVSGNRNLVDDGKDGADGKRLTSPPSRNPRRGRVVVAVAGSFCGLVFSRLSADRLSADGNADLRALFGGQSAVGFLAIGLQDPSRAYYGTDARADPARRMPPRDVAAPNQATNRGARGRDDGRRCLGADGCCFHDRSRLGLLLVSRWLCRVRPDQRGMCRGNGTVVRPVDRARARPSPTVSDREGVVLHLPMALAGHIVFLSPQRLGVGLSGLRAVPRSEVGWKLRARHRSHRKRPACPHGATRRLEPPAIYGRQRTLLSQSADETLSGPPGSVQAWCCSEQRC